MTRIVRFEEIDGELVLRVPADIAERLGLAPGGEAALSAGPTELTLSRLDEKQRRQIEIGRRIIGENHEVLAALAK